MGHLARLAGEYSDHGVRFLGVLVDVYSSDGELAADARSMAESAGAKYPQLTMTEPLMRGISYIPSTRVYDSSGNIIAGATGIVSHDDWVNIIETALAAQ